MFGSTSGPFGTVLKHFRKRQRLTQQQLANAIGAHRNTIGRWEEGSFLPESKTLVLDLARCLHLDEHEARQLLDGSCPLLGKRRIDELLKASEQARSLRRVTLISSSFPKSGNEPLNGGIYTLFFTRCRQTGIRREDGISSPGLPACKRDGMLIERDIDNITHNMVARKSTR